MKQLRSSLGFTLIELLVVIGIIMILSIAFLATINPLEQTERAKDHATRTLASDFIDAARHYTATTQYSVICPTSSCSGAYSVGALNTLASINTALFNNNNAQTATSFISNTYASRITVSASSSTFDAMLTACWQPNSLAEKSKRTSGDRSQTVWNSTGTADCSSADAASNTCYQCIWQ